MILHELKKSDKAPAQPAQNFVARTRQRWRHSTVIVTSQMFVIVASACSLNIRPLPFQILQMYKRLSLTLLPPPQHPIYPTLITVHISNFLFVVCTCCFISLFYVDNMDISWSNVLVHTNLLLIIQNHWQQVIITKQFWLISHQPTRRPIRPIISPVSPTIFLILWPDWAAMMLAASFCRLSNRPDRMTVQLDCCVIAVQIVYL